MKGMVFTMITYMLIAFLISLVVVNVIRWKAYGESTKTIIRSDELAYLAKSISADLKRETEILGKRNMAFLINHIIQTGEPINSTEQVFPELIINGSVNGLHLNGTEGNTILDWIEKIKNHVKEIGFVLEVGDSGSSDDFNFVSVEISPYDSWNFTLNVTIRNVTLRDKSGYPRIEGRLPRKSEWIIVSILDLEDPYWPLNTYGRITRTIKNCNFTPYTIHGQDNATILNECINLEYYHSSKEGPCLFERLEMSRDRHSYYENQAAKLRNISQNEVVIGLETWVNVEELREAGLDELIIENQTTIDYLYFEGINPGLSIEGAPQWFRLNETQAEKYGLEIE